MDEETGLYYYGARHLDPKYSTWISTDPALGEYIPAAGKGNSKDAGSLSGMGGVYNHINFHLYHYAGNNPVRYLDPDGRQCIEGTSALALIEEIESPIVVDAITSTSLNVFQKAGIIGGILAFVFSLQGDSIQPALPPGFQRVDGNIISPSGTSVATIEQSWRLYNGDVDWTSISEWGKGSFESSNDSLFYHFKKHGNEVKANTPEQYLNKAKAFKQNLKNAKRTPSYDSQTGEKNATRYDKNGKFIILDDTTNEILSFGKTTE